MALPSLNTITQIQKVILDLYQRVTDIEDQLEAPDPVVVESVDDSEYIDGISDVEPPAKRRGRPPKVKL